MATSKPEYISKDVEDFATELFDYIWTRHRFRSESLEKIFAEKLSLMIDKPKKASKVDKNIGHAVLCSQYLLRELCEYNFIRFHADLTQSTTFFYICVYDVIMSWIKIRSNVFLKVIDSAAIIAEAILFCDENFNSIVELSRAPVTFENFFRTFLQADFFANGGWNGLKVKAFADYHRLYLDVRPYICSVRLPYKTLDHSCYLTIKLKVSPVVFPVGISKFCNECKSRLDVIYMVCKEISAFKYSQEGLAHVSIKEEEIFQKIDDLVKGYDEDTSRIVENVIQEYFVHALLGKKEQALELAEKRAIKQYNENIQNKSTEIPNQK